ncbi:MAG: hypothetical protein N2C12_15905, partial [Planctomycetales bacterium]
MGKDEGVAPGYGDERPLAKNTGLQTSKMLRTINHMPALTMRDKTIKRATGFTNWPFLLATCLLISSINLTATAQDKVTTDEARAIAKEAYIFNYPLVMYYRTMYLQAIDKDSKSFSGGFGKWLHLGTSS